MASTLKIPSPLRRFTNGQATLDVSGATIRHVLDELFSEFPDIKGHLIEDSGELRNFVNIYIGKECIKHLGGAEATVDPGADIRIIPSIAGGAPELSPAELSRYSRHLILPEVGINGQKKLKAAKVLVVGAGGLGSPVSLYLTAAGVGNIGLVDFDIVDESNLQRQVLFGVDQVGKSKVKSAQERLESLNPNTNFILHEEPLNSHNALDIIKDYDMVVDGTDNFPTRYLVNDACVLLGKPNVYGSIYRFDGQVSVFNHEDGPCYRCLYPAPPPPGLVPSCAEGGVLGVLPGIVGCLQANETIKLILGVGDSMKGRFLLFDALGMEFNELVVRKNDDCVICGSNPSITQLIDYQEFCGISQDDQPKIEEITVTELKSKWNDAPSTLVLDVREDFELEIAKIDGVIHIPMKQIADRIDEFDPNNELIIMCRSGQRSAKICEEFLEKNFKNVKNLKGGILAWSEEIDSSIPQY